MTDTRREAVLGDLQALSNDNPHRIAITHDRETITLRFQCLADNTAACHQYPNCDCGGWCECPKVPQDECWAEGWMNGGDCTECFTGEPGTPARSAPITITFTGDCLEWTYA